MRVSSRFALWSHSSYAVRNLYLFALSGLSSTVRFSYLLATVGSVFLCSEGFVSICNIWSLWLCCEGFVSICIVGPASVSYLFAPVGSLFFCSEGFVSFCTVDLSSTPVWVSYLFALVGSLFSCSVGFVSICTVGHSSYLVRVSCVFALWCISSSAVRVSYVFALWGISSYAVGYLFFLHCMSVFYPSVGFVSFCQSRISLLMQWVFRIYLHCGVFLPMQWGFFLYICIVTSLFFYSKSFVSFCTLGLSSTPVWDCLFLHCGFRIFFAMCFCLFQRFGICIFLKSMTVVCISYYFALFLSFTAVWIPLLLAHSDCLLMQVWVLYCFEAVLLSFNDVCSYLFALFFCHLMQWERSILLYWEFVCFWSVSFVLLAQCDCLLIQYGFRIYLNRMSVF